MSKPSNDNEKKPPLRPRRRGLKNGGPVTGDEAVGGDTVSFTPKSAASESDTSADDRFRRAEMRRAEAYRRIRQLPSRAYAMWKEYRAHASMHVKEGMIGFALGVCAYLLGSCRLPFDTYPLGLALLCASPKKMAWLFFGLCASALTVPDGVFVYIFAYATAVTVRILSRLLIDIPEAEPSEKLKRKAADVFTESIYLRMATGCAASFMIGLYFLMVRGFIFYDLFAAIFAMLCTPVAVFVYAGCFNDGQTDRRFHGLSLTALAVSITYAIRSMNFIGISVGIFFAFFITVYACRRKGLWQGLILGLLCGLAYAPGYAPMFALSGLVAHLMWSVSASWAMTAACAVAVMWGFYVEGSSAISHVLPAVMLSAASYTGAQKLSFFPAAKDLLFSGKYCSDMNDADMSALCRKEYEYRLTELSDTFESLSEIFYNLSDRLSRPQLPELRRMCDSVYDKYCPVCPNRDLCWELEYSASADILGSIGDMLLSRGVAGIEELPEYMRIRCSALPGIIGEINLKSAELIRLSGMSDKTGVFAMDYAAVSGLLADASRRGREDMILDSALSERLTEVLSDYGFGEGGVCVYGKRRKRIIARGFDMSGTGSGIRQLKKSVEETCGFSVGDPVIELGEGTVTMRIDRGRSMNAHTVFRVNNTGVEECGDTVSAFESSDDKQVVIISDGMGRGREAAFTSGVCSVFLQKLIGTGNRADTVIKMLGNFVRSKPGECSSTVDLMELDLLTGRAEFYKCGAAASFVRRGGNLFKLAAETVPLGILTSGDIGKLSFDTQAGDVIIMLSDGVALGNDDSIWLLDLLTSGFDDNLELMAEKIISEARKRGSDDDISVALTSISG